MSASAKIDQILYWNLPGPQEMVRRLSSGIREHRVSLIHHNNRPVPGLWDAVRRGLAQAHLDKVITIAATDGMDIAGQIQTQLELPAMSATKLAECHLDQPVGMVLISAQNSGPNGRARCEAFVDDFLKASAGSNGNVYLVARAPDSTPMTGAAQHIIRFDGALIPDEMIAYVASRMVGRSGPGGTRLLRAIVTEYAGFDALLAEQLMQLDDADILGLPAPLNQFVDFEGERWAHQNWINGTEQNLDGQRVPHPLFECYAAKHSGPNSEAMKKALGRRYWRACATALLPWLEDLRQEVLLILMPSLKAFLDADPARRERKVGRFNKVIVLQDDEIEFNNIVGLHHQQGYNPPSDPICQLALSVSILARDVRNEIAHLRPPQPQQIQALASQADQLGILKKRYDQGT